MLKFLFWLSVLFGAVCPMVSAASSQTTQVKKRDSKAAESSRRTEQVLKNLSPVTIEDIDRGEMFQLTADGKSTGHGLSKGTWKIDEGHLIIQDLEGHRWKYPVELKKDLLFIDGASEARGRADAPANGHHWIVNTPE